MVIMYYAKFGKQLETCPDFHSISSTSSVMNCQAPYNIRELTIDELEGVTGGWELDQLTHGALRRWNKYQEQLNSDDKELREAITNSGR